jgi:tRNA U34 5-methylaminomethyl-2-thiouridine-forming methyltransferase MnmC
MEHSTSNDTDAMSEEFSLVTVAAGVKSLRSLEHGETFHPVVGPMAEARGLHVGQSRIVERLKGGAEKFVVWDVGLGAGANAIAVLEAVGDLGVELELHSFDCTLAPLRFAREHAEELEYARDWVGPMGELIEQGETQIGAVKWRRHLGDFREEMETTAAPAPGAILYDPYSPRANPGLWTLEHFARLRARAGKDCMLTSYSRSTAVRVTLALAGFFVGRGTATGEKDETTVAATRRELLENPLGEEWLGRVKRSTRGGPLREGREAGRIAEGELAELRERVGR